MIIHHYLNSRITPRSSSTCLPVEEGVAAQSPDLHRWLPGCSSSSRPSAPRIRLGWIQSQIRLKRCAAGGGLQGMNGGKEGPPSTPPAAPRTTTPHTAAKQGVLLLVVALLSPACLDSCQGVGYLEPACQSIRLTSVGGSSRPFINLGTSHDLPCCRGSRDLILNPPPETVVPGNASIDQRRAGLGAASIERSALALLLIAWMLPAPDFKVQLGPPQLSSLKKICC